MVRCSTGLPARAAHRHRDSLWPVRRAWPWRWPVRPAASKDREAAADDRSCHRSFPEIAELARPTTARAGLRLRKTPNALNPPLKSWEMLPPSPPSIHCLLPRVGRQFVAVRTPGRLFAPAKFSVDCHRSRIFLVIAFEARKPVDESCLSPDALFPASRFE